MLSRTPVKPVASNLFFMWMRCKLSTRLNRASHTYINENDVIKCNETQQFVKQDLFSFVENRIKTYGNRKAMVDCHNGATITYSQLLDNSKRLTNFLQKQGLKERDCVAAHIPNCIEYPMVVFGTMAGGMYLTTANPAYPAQNLSFQWKDSNAKALFTSSKLLDIARKSAENTNIELFISIDKTSCTDQRVVNLCDIIERYDANYKTELSIDPQDDLALLLYSSGTTGLPKGVMHTHYSIMCNMIQMLNGIGSFLQNRSLGLLPFFHVFGMVAILFTSLAHGSTIYTLPSFEPASFLEAIEKYKIERLPAAHPILLFLLSHPLVKKYDLSSLVALSTGGSPTDAYVTNAFHKKFPHALLQQSYGMTECLITHWQPKDKKEHVAGSAGRSFSGVEWKVTCLDTGKALPPNEKGEINVRGPQIMKGYFNNPEATRNSLNEDGWLSTGDVGYYDKDLNIYIIDRIKDLIKYKAFQVAPAELEDLLMSHDDVVDSCVIGIPDERAGELPRAFVVVKESSRATTDDIQSYVDKLVPNFMKLHGGVQFVDTLPKSVSGKLLRREVKDKYSKGLMRKK